VIGIGYWSTHDTDVIPTEALGKFERWKIAGPIRKTLAENGVRCSMVTAETFHQAVWAAGLAAEAPGVRAVRSTGAQHGGHRASEATISLEMKIAPKSSVTQVLKYALLALAVEQQKKTSLQAHRSTISWWAAYQGS
jgi:hypothetical protein